MHSDKSESRGASKDLVCGLIAGAANVVSGYPFDTLKVRLQANKGMYDGLSDCFWHIWRTEGVSTSHHRLHHFRTCLTAIVPQQRAYCRVVLCTVQAVYRLHLLYVHGLQQLLR